jgi:hypothetical protein
MPVAIPLSNTFIPVKLTGQLCDSPVVWRTEYTGTNSGDLIFYGDGPTGIVGFLMGYNSNTGVMLIPNRPIGVLQIWATVGGVEYGPVTITLEDS